VLLAQWVLNVLQFLTLLAVVWYAWEARRGGVLLARQYEREWKPMYHFSIKGLDPTTCTGQVSGATYDPLKLIASVVNLGRSALVIRGFLIHPLGAVGTSVPIDPLPIPTGQAQECGIPTKPLLGSLLVSGLIPAKGSYMWRGKVSLALWFEASGETHKSGEQYFDMEINTGSLTSIRQITQVEFEYLSRVPLKN
jgi:hypothetical protein